MSLSRVLGELLLRARCVSQDDEVDSPFSSQDTHYIALASTRDRPAAYTGSFISLVCIVRVYALF